MTRLLIFVLVGLFSMTASAGKLKSGVEAVNKVSDIVSPTFKLLPTDSRGIQKIANRFGEDVAIEFRKKAEKLGVSQEAMIDAFDRLGKAAYHKRKIHYDVINFSARNSSSGSFWFVKRFQKIRHVVDLNDKKFDKVLHRIWRCVDGRSIGCDFKAMQYELNKLGRNDSLKIRNYIEELVPKMAYVGKLKGIPKGAKLYPAHHNNIHGIDFVSVDSKNRLSIIEFGTGKKPAAYKTKDGLHQMELAWIQSKWISFLRNATADQMLELRSAGVPNRMLRVKIVKKMKAKQLRKYTARKYISPDIDRKLVEKLHGPDHGIALLEQ